MRLVQRGANEHPGGSWPRFGTTPSIATRRSPVRPWESRPAAPACRDARARGRSPHRAFLDDAAARTSPRPGRPSSAMTPRSCVMSSSDRSKRALHLAQQVEDLRLHGDVERGRRLVGDDQRRLAGQRHRHHHALPHAARQLVRVVVDALSRDRRSARRRSSSTARSRASRRRGQAVHDQRLADLLADAHHRVERRHRFLEDQADAGARARAHLLLARAPAGRGPRRSPGPPVIRPRRLHQAQQRERRHRLAAAGFADQAERLALARGRTRRRSPPTSGVAPTSNTVVRCLTDSRRSTCSARPELGASPSHRDLAKLAEHARASYPQSRPPWRRLRRRR